MAAHKPREIKCLRCGKTFMGGARAKYCPECRPERAREYNREYNHKMGEPGWDARPKTIICEICGAEVPVKPRGALPKCCPACSHEAEKSASKQRRAERAARNKRAKRKKPALSFEDIRAMQSRREVETGRRPTYGQIAAEPYLAQQAAEMEARRRQREGR